MHKLLVLTLTFYLATKGCRWHGCIIIILW